MDEIDRLLAAARPHLRPILVTALNTGMRRGELLNLRWRDVDLNGRVLYVTESKNGEGIHIPMSEELSKTLWHLPSRFRGGHVFPSSLPRRDKSNSTDGPTQPFTDLKNSFKAALETAEIKDFRFHDLRHTFASQLVMNGADLNTVRELLGDKSLAMTLRYAHLSPEHKREAIGLIDNAFGGIGCTAGDTPTDTGKIVAFPMRR